MLVFTPLTLAVLSLGPAATLSAPADSVRSLPIELATPVGTVYGTLALPAGAGRARIPVVLIVAGSGPTDRDGNTPLLAGKSSPLRLLAEALAANGIASVRYDKRGIAASHISPEAMTAIRFDDFADDATSWIRKLAADPRFSRVIVAGHSEGSLIGAIAAARVPSTAYISLEGAAKPAAVTLREQLAPQLAAAPDLLAHADSILVALNAGHTVDSVPPRLLALFNPAVQKYEISWFAHDPVAEISRVSGPILIVQGRNDMQVTESHGRLIASALGSRARFVLIDSMTHELKLAGSDQQSQMRTYTDGTLPLAPALVAAVVDFINKPNVAAR